MYSVSIVVLCYNELSEATRPCLDSIIANTPIGDYELIIVDNASTDGTVEYLKKFSKKHAHIRLQLNDVNKGYAAGNNDGIRLSKSQYVVLLNNDTLVCEGWLERLVKLFSNGPNIGLVGPVTNSAGNEQCIGLPGLNEKNFETIAGVYVKQHDGVWFSTERLGFFCVAIRRQVLDKIGLLDEQFGLGMFEDDDYCVRARKAKFTLAIVEDCFVYHKGSVTFSKLSGQDYHQLFETNKAYFRIKHRLEWAFTDIALSYWKKINHDLKIYAKTEPCVPPEIESILVRLRNFKHLLLQIHRAELSNRPKDNFFGSNHSTVSYSKWRSRWDYFKQHLLCGTNRERKRYLRSLPNRIMRRYIKEQPTPVISTFPVAQKVLEELNRINSKLFGKKIIIFPATVDYYYMTQRPQQLAHAFAKAGYMVIYGTLNRQKDRVDITEQIMDNLYLLNEHHFASLMYVFKREESIYYCLWPNNIKHMKYLPFTHVLYDYMDELSLLDLPESQLEQEHLMMLNQADLITVSSDKLMKNLPEHVLPKTLLVNNAVSQTFFDAIYADNSLVTVPDMLGTKDILGYYGAIAEWLDFDLIESLAKSLPDVRIVMIGPISEGVSKRVVQILCQCENVVVFPVCNQVDLIPFLKRFDVCLLPFIKNKVTDAVSPVKLFEYFSVGKPVVSTNIPECAKYTPVRVAMSHDEFIDMVRQVLLDDIRKQDVVAQQIAKNNTWRHRVEEIEAAINLKMESLTT